MALRLRAKGFDFKEIGELVLAEREEISLGLHRGASLRSIAAGLGRSLSTVSREVTANGGRGDYRAWRAHQRAAQRSRRPKALELAKPELTTEVTRWLKKGWSPQEISVRLSLEFPHDPMMWLSHETIYKSLFVQGRGELRRELTRRLRSGRTQRRP